MSSFTTSLIVSPLSNGRDWKLVNHFTYHIGSKSSRRFIKVPRKFETDFASVPRMFFFLPDWATYQKSAVLHDWMYQTHTITGSKGKLPISRGVADKIFLEAMLVEFRHHKSGKFVAYLEYLAVRMFAWLAW